MRPPGRAGHGRRAQPTAWPRSLPRPTATPAQLPDRRRPRRRRLGHRRAAGRRAGRRRARRRAGRRRHSRMPRPLPRHGHLLVARADRRPRPHASTRSPIPSPPAASPPLQLVGRPDHRTLDLAALRAAGVELAGRLTGIDGPSRRLRRRPRPHRGRRRPDGCSGCSPRSTPTSRRPGSAPRCSSPRPSLRPSSATRRHRSTSPSEASARSSGRPASAARYPWLHVPVLDGAGEIAPAPRRHGRARRLRRRPALPAPPQLQLHRRRRPRRRLRRRPPRPPPPLGGPCGSDGRRLQGSRPCTLTVPTTTSSSSVPVPPARPRRCCSPGPACGVLVVDRSRYGADTLSTHALMRGGVLQLHRWGLLDRIVEAGTPPVRRTTLHVRRRRDRRPDQARPRRRRPLRAAAHRARSGARRRRHRGRCRSAVRRHGHRPPARSGQPGRSASRAGTTTAAPWPSTPTSWSVPTASARRSPSCVGAPFERRGTGASAAVYGYWSGLEDRRLRMDLPSRGVLRA